MFFSGLVLAAATTGLAARRDHPREIAVLLSLARVGALMVVAGGIATLALGFWLVELTEREPSESWLSASVALLLATFVLGAIGGRPLKRARVLSANASADASSAEISELLRMPVARAANSHRRARFSCRARTHGVEARRLARHWRSLPTWPLDTGIRERRDTS